MFLDLVCVYQRSWKRLRWNDASVATPVRQTALESVRTAYSIVDQFDYLAYQSDFWHRAQAACWWNCPWKIGYMCVCTYIYHFILNLRTRWKWMASFTPRPFYLWGNGARYPLSKRLSWTQSLSRLFRERKCVASPGNLTMIGQLSSPLPSHYTFWAMPPFLLRRVNCKTNSFF